MTPLNRRRFALFKANKRAFGALIVFGFLFVVSLFAEILANDKPLIVRYKGQMYFPMVHMYTDADFGGLLPTEADYKDPFTRNEIETNGWMVMPPVPYRYDSVDYFSTEPFPAAPSIRDRTINSARKNVWNLQRKRMND